MIGGYYKAGTGKMPMEASLIDVFIILLKLNGVTISYSSYMFLATKLKARVKNILNSSMAVITKYF